MPRPSDVAKGLADRTRLTRDQYKGNRGKRVAPKGAPDLKPAKIRLDFGQTKKGRQMTAGNINIGKYGPAKGTKAASKAKKYPAIKGSSARNDAQNKRAKKVPNWKKIKGNASKFLKAQTAAK